MEQQPLTAADRCDRCGAQAYARTLHDSGELLWCAHHLQETPQVRAFLVHDETHLLAPPLPQRVPS